MKARHVVVQEAPEIIRCSFALYRSSLMPMTIVTASAGMEADLSFILKGAEAMTFWAPAWRWPCNDPFLLSGGTAGSRNFPVVSTTRGTPRLFQGSSFGLRS